MSNLAPVRREILVKADPMTAFEVFTAHIGSWWPLAELSVFGGDAAVSFTDGEIVEQSPGGERTSWGSVTRWEPGAAVAFTWHPGRANELTTNVEVTFAAAGDETLVTLVHSGWEVFADPAAAREEYQGGWAMVLDRYRGGGQPGSLTPFVLSGVAAGSTGRAGPVTAPRGRRRPRLGPPPGYCCSRRSGQAKGGGRAGTLGPHRSPGP